MPQVQSIFEPVTNSKNQHFFAPNQTIYRIRHIRESLSRPFKIWQPIIFHISLEGFYVSQLTSPGSTIINVVLLAHYITYDNLVT